MFLGLDAMDPQLVDEMIRDGELPALAGLHAASARARFENEPGYFVGSVWPTLMTGVPVDEHGWATGTRFRPESYDYVNHPLSATPVWTRFSEGGRRVAVFDAPHVVADPKLNGVQICEWGCHDREYGTHSWPEGLIAEIDAVAGRHPIGTRPTVKDPRHSPCDHVHREGELRSTDETRGLFADVIEAVACKERASLAVLDREQWDLYYCVVGEAHCGGHQLWHLHDPTHERYDGALAAELGHPLRAVYRRIDSLVAAHLERLRPDDVAYVALSHGMQAHHDGTHILAELLQVLGDAFAGRPSPGRRSGLARAGVAALPPAVGRAAMRLAGPVASRYLSGRVPAEIALRPLAEQVFIPIDNNTVSAALRVNLRGREAAGRVPRPDLDAALDWLATRLRELVSVDDGRPVVKEVIKATDLYADQPDLGLADLIFEWDRSRPIGRVWSPFTGVVGRPYRGVRTGDHRSGGRLLARGARIRPGSTTITPLDVGPTLLAAAGLDPTGMKGQPVPALLPSETPIGAGGLARLTAAARRPRRAGLRPSARAVRAELQGLLAAHHVTRVMAEEQAKQIAELQGQLDEARDGARQGQLASEILATSQWIRRSPVPVTDLVSVVIATRNRRTRLAAALESVRRQSYDEIEIVVVDDASDDGTWDLLTTVEDPRVRPLRLEPRAGTNAARNHALDAATGTLITYLDDDNEMDADWVRSLVWTFQQQPDRHVVYGARVIDDVERHHGRSPGGLPGIQLLDWDADSVRHANRVDINVLAHRRSGARFPTDITLLGDWDLLLQLTQNCEPLRLPVIASYYSTDAPARMTTSDQVLMDREVAAMRARWSRR